ncbi:MAG: hypothetical protein ACYCPS_04605 [Candidatus Saccharimonadales bacterium]
MTIWWFYLIAAFIFLCGLAFIWVVITLSRGGGRNKSSQDVLEEAADKNIERIFTDDFREELKNRGRLHFEKIINESAEFLQQDLRLTSSQLNDFMKTELTTKVRAELSKYEQSINDARDLAIEAIKKTSLALDEQRKVLSEQVQSEIAKEKQQIITNFEKQLTDIVSHYIITAIGNEVDLNDQLDFIIANFEANKEAMIRDIKNDG